VLEPVVARYREGDLRRYFCADAAFANPEVHGENHTRDGMHMAHTNVGQGNQCIVSNVQLIHPNMSRNFGSGVKSVYSCNAAFGSFINNAEGGIVAPEGLRVGFANNGENTGEAVYIVPNNGYGSYILYSEASTEGSTHARRWDSKENDWVSVGKPTLYVVSRGAGVAETGNHIATYAGAMKSSAVRVVKQGHKPALRVDKKDSKSGSKTATFSSAVTPSGPASSRPSPRPIWTSGPACWPRRATSPRPHHGAGEISSGCLARRKARIVR